MPFPPAARAAVCDAGQRGCKGEGRSDGDATVHIDCLTGQEGRVIRGVEGTDARDVFRAAPSLPKVFASSVMRLRSEGVSTVPGQTALNRRPLAR
jgi:hypothetical protein